MSKSARRIPLSATLAALLPLGAAAAADLPPMQLEEPVRQPAAKTLSTDLVDRVIPAYGTYHYQPYRKDSRLESLYNRIRLFTSVIDARVMSGELVRPPTKWVKPTDEQGRSYVDADLVPAERAPLPEELELLGLMEELAIFKASLPFPNHYEEWHLDNSWRDLNRSADLLRLGLNEDGYLNLEAQYHAWYAHYQQLLRLARAEYAIQLMETEGLSSSQAMSRATQDIQQVPYPKMRADASYPEITIPEIAKPTGRVAEPEPEPLPEMVAEEPPADIVAASNVPPSPELASALLERGSELFNSGVAATDGDQRDSFFNQAAIVLGEAIQVYQAVDDASLSSELEEARSKRTGAVRSARTAAAENPAAVSAANTEIAAIRADIAASMPKPDPVDMEPEPVEEPEMLEPVTIPEAEPEAEPEIVEPEPEPEMVEPEPEPEPEPEMVEPEPAPEPEKPAEGKSGGDDFEWPDL